MVAARSRRTSGAKSSPNCSRLDAEARIAASGVRRSWETDESRALREVLRAGARLGVGLGRGESGAGQGRCAGVGQDLQQGLLVGAQPVLGGLAPRRDAQRLVGGAQGPQGPVLDGPAPPAGARPAFQVVGHVQHLGRGPGVAGPGDAARTVADEGAAARRGGEVAGQLLADHGLLGEGGELARGAEERPGGPGAGLGASRLIADPAREVAGQHGHRQEDGEREEVLGFEGEREPRLDEVEVVDQEREAGGEVGGPRSEEVGRHQDRGQEHHRQPRALGEPEQDLGGAGREDHEAGGGGISGEDGSQGSQGVVQVEARAGARDGRRPRQANGAPAAAADWSAGVGERGQSDG